MPKRSSSDINETAFRIMQQSTGQAAPVPTPAPAKNPAAVALGRLGGLKGGKARAESLSAKRRKQIARAAAAKRWSVKLPA
jgi:hypothetical protein